MFPAEKYQSRFNFLEIFHLNDQFRRIKKPPHSFATEKR